MLCSRRIPTNRRLKPTTRRIRGTLHEQDHPRDLNQPGNTSVDCIFLLLKSFGWYIRDTDISFERDPDLVYVKPPDRLKNLTVLEKNDARSLGNPISLRNIDQLLAIDTDERDGLGLAILVFGRKGGEFRAQSCGERRPRGIEVQNQKGQRRACGQMRFKFGRRGDLSER
ncbi:hypothetical protein ES702_06321 [subsurface metagenome]